MAESYKKLGQSNPSAATLTAMYTVPALTSVVGSTISVCNRSATATTFRISHAIAGAADNDAQYFAYDAPIPGNGVIPFTIGPTMATTDVIRVYATLATLTFSMWGTEIT
jgi:hypothetical protein